MDNDAKKAAKRLIHGFFDDVMIGSTVQFVEDHDKQFKQFGSELADDKQQRTQFLGLVSHELRTPLTPILLDLAILEKDGRVADQLRPALTRIRHNVEVETALIDDLLDATRLTQGSLELRLEDVDMHKLLLSEITACELN
jgi:signal transduction histidine kinase